MERFPKRMRVSSPVLRPRSRKVRCALSHTRDLNGRGRDRAKRKTLSGKVLSSFDTKLLQLLTTTRVDSSKRTAANRSGSARESLSFSRSESALAAGRRGCLADLRRQLVVAGAQILVRIHRDHVHAHLVMQVRAGCASGLAHVADDLAARDMLAR